MKHSVKELKANPTSEHPEVTVTMDSGRTWWFRRCNGKDHLMSGSGTVQFKSEYQAAKEAARLALGQVEGERRSAGKI